jgi:hypothetical protein
MLRARGHVATAVVIPRFDLDDVRALLALVFSG